MIFGFALGNSFSLLLIFEECDPYSLLIPLLSFIIQFMSTLTSPKCHSRKFLKLEIRL